MSSLIVICLFSYYRFVLLPHYKLVPPRASVVYVQTISNDVVRASPQLVPPLGKTNKKGIRKKEKANTKQKRQNMSHMHKYFYTDTTFVFCPVLPLSITLIVIHALPASCKIICQICSICPFFFFF
jgi:hypothetical protein